MRLLSWNPPTEPQQMRSGRIPLAQRMEVPTISRTSSDLSLQSRMERSRGPIQPGKVVPKWFNNPTTQGELSELVYWADRGQGGTKKSVKYQGLYKNLRPWGATLPSSTWYFSHVSPKIEHLHVFSIAPLALLAVYYHNKCHKTMPWGK